MIYLPVTILLFLTLLLFPFILFSFAIDVVQVAVAKLGFSPQMALLLLVLVVLGSTINIPLYRTESQVEIVSDFADLWRRQFWGIPLQKMRQMTIVALNVGGGLIPVLLAVYQFRRADSISILLVTAIVTLISYYAAHVVPGIGIQMNPAIPPLTAALSATIIAGTQVPAVAFAGGVLGTVIGADLLHLRELDRMTAGVLSIGGAGVFDGIALCGLFALLLS
ncbi:MAG TPA: DUF1614 domain-containing protein [Oscillatoriales cyanobacterium M59_W2019_021]|nr:DUF1614 domain-containing protein [Oscillatoriales cyanobacterium M4454_W2019_049]HIK52945.1 DUF1614 domain-containing protein [Oscillatoriales cyanobacterium M59_W2019_021]